jgi:hypothetical protein
MKRTATLLCLLALLLAPVAFAADKVYSGTSAANTAQAYDTPGFKNALVQVWGDGSAAATVNVLWHATTDAPPIAVNASGYANPTVTGKAWSGPAGSRITVQVTGWSAGNVYWRVVLK